MDIISAKLPVRKYSKDLEQGGLEIPARLTINNTNKKMTDVMKEKLNPSLRSTEESTVNENSFRVLNILYITNFCETRKINSNSMRVPFLFLNFRKIRKCVLN